MKKNENNSEIAEFLEKREKLEKKNKILFLVVAVLFITGTALIGLFFNKRLEIFWGVAGAWFVFICITILFFILCVKNEIRRRMPASIIGYFYSPVRRYLNVQLSFLSPALILIALGLFFSYVVALSKSFLIEILFEKSMMYSFLIFVLFCSLLAPKIFLRIANKYLGKEKK
jgi:uncharacterized membrane protein (DUF485 family)